MKTPIDAPATPAAQPYGSYKPTHFDQRVADIIRDCVLYSTGTQAVITARANGYIH